jgi:hypothetical protein
MQMTRTRFIPKGAVKVADKLSDAVAYLYTDSKRNRPCVIVYYGKQSKAVAHHSYRDDAERAKSIAGYFSGRQSHDRGRAETKAKRLAPNRLVLGDILTTCWGYDQTNREAYEVVAVSGQYVTIRQIGMASETSELGDRGHCVPQSGQFIGQPMRKLVQYGDSVSIESYITATKWNTEIVAGVPVGPSLYWSSYA